jgi:hypothetical protein
LFGSRPSGSFDGSAGRHFLGLIDEPALFNRALTADEIAAIANAGSAGMCKGVPFTGFTAQAALEFGPRDRDDSFKLTSAFSLGKDSNGIAPLNEEVSLQVGAFSTTIPAGSFGENGKGRFVFQGVINHVTLEVVIRSLGSGESKFTANAADVNLTGTGVPLTVKLAIGDDVGSASLAKGKAEYGK